MKNIKINPILILPLAVSWWFGFLESYISMFLILTFHEAAHLLAVNSKKAELEHIKIEPFGINIKLKEDYIKNPWDEIIIALAGPLMNLFLSAFFMILPVKNQITEFIITANLSLAAVNLIPALPLDGGRILRAFLSLFTGHIKSYQYCFKITKYISFFLIITGIYIMYKTRFNFSLCLIGCFLFFNLITEQKNSKLYIMKEIAEYKEKQRYLSKTLKICDLAVLPDYKPVKILEHLSFNRYYKIHVIDKTKDIGSLTETQLIEGLIKFGSDVKILDLLDMM
ncbi:MAG: site-2 protease family protein [Clostridia bacterium]|nr:site-2 protease family protein [Clostridia bacterium]